jgi:hypothetical protein
LTALGGFAVGINPCSYDYVKYKVRYRLSDVERAIADKVAYWMHPVPRNYDDVLRKAIRQDCGFYGHSDEPMTHPVSVSPHRSLVLARSVTAKAARFTGDAQWPNTRWVGTMRPAFDPALPILRRIRQIKGYLEIDEARTLLRVTQRALREFCEMPRLTIVETDADCGKATTVIGAMIWEMRSAAKIWVMRHKAPPNRTDTQEMAGLYRSARAFRDNIERAGLAEIVRCSDETLNIDELRGYTIGLALISGTRDRATVSKAYDNVRHHLAHRGYLLFQGYSIEQPEVMAFVDELLEDPSEYRRVELCHGLCVLQRCSAALDYLDSIKST